MMRYAAIDIETTGLDPERCQILEIGCVIEMDWKTPVDELPSFRAVCDPGEIRGEPFALAMNAGLLREIADAKPAMITGQIIDLSGFICKHLGEGTITIAGKNFGAFDYQFLRREPQWGKLRLVRHRHRFIDVGNLWWRPNCDTELPSLEACRARANLPPRPAHNAVDDCRTVIELVRAARG
jgi:DNA polymerase III epsilon subunit-like protein